MNGGPAVVTEAPPAAQSMAKAEVPKVADASRPREVGPSNAGDAQSRKEAHKIIGETITGQISRGEAIAQLVGHIATASACRDIEPVRKTALVMLSDKRISKETHDFLLNQLPVLDSVIQAVEKSECGLDTSMTLNARLAFGEDVDLHILRRQLRMSSGEMSEKEVADLKKDIAGKEKIRSELKNEDGTEIKDQVEEFAIMLADGEKAKLQEDPIGYIGKFFTEELPKLMTSELGKKSLAKRMGLTPEQLSSVAETFNMMQEYQKIFDQVHEITSDYEAEHLPKGKISKMKKTGLMLLNLGSILSAILAYQAFKRSKEEQR
jgi:hypothetical protein